MVVAPQRAQPNAHSLFSSLCWLFSSFSFGWCEKRASSTWEPTGCAKQHQPIDDNRQWRAFSDKSHFAHRRIDAIVRLKECFYPREKFSVEATIIKSNTMFDKEINWIPIRIILHTTTHCSRWIKTSLTLGTQIRNANNQTAQTATEMSANAKQKKTFFFVLVYDSPIFQFVIKFSNLWQRLWPPNMSLS